MNQNFKNLHSISSELTKPHKTLTKWFTSSMGAKRGVYGQIGCEMGERVRGIYRAKKQWTFGSRGVHPVLLHSGPKAVSYV